MASLTPGVLSKLLDNVGTRVAGEHRSALLQVIGIVPSLVGGDGGDFCRSRGFFLRVSDSIHSAYVSISDEDADLILNDEIQLGQYIHVARLDSASPVPVLRGVKPVPRRRPCVGEPKDLISSDALSISTKVGFSSAAAKKKGTKIVKREGVKKPKDLSKERIEGMKRQETKAKKLVCEESRPRRLSMENGKVEGLDLRRLSLDSSRRGWDRSSPRPQSRSKMKEGSSSSDAVLKSACVESKPRRLLVENGKVEGLELRRLSLESTRRGRDQSKGTKDSPRPQSHSKLEETTRSSETSFQVHSSRKASSDKDSTMKNPNLSISPLKSKNEYVSQKLMSKPLGKDLKSSFDGTLPNHLTKVPLCFKTWSDRKVSWDLLPHAIHDRGKEAMAHRDHAFLAAVHALEEASAAECVIRCTSMFAELCESSQKDSAGNLVEKFLDLHQDMRNAAAVVDSLLSTRLQEPKNSPHSNRPLPQICENLPNKNAISWVLAAVETDISKFCLFRKEEKRENLHGEKCHLVVLESTSNKVSSETHSPQCKRSPSSQRSSLSESRAKGPSPTQKHASAAKRTETESSGWSKGKGLKEAATLAEKLVLESRAWFLNYLEDSLTNGFGLRVGEGGSEIATLLRQLKRVDQWLDDSVVDGNGSDERIEGLKKKLYGFLLEHVDSAMVASR